MFGQQFLGIGTLVGAMMIAPGISFATVDQPCGVAEAGLSCSQEAADLLSGIQQDNREVLHQIRDRRFERVQANLANMNDRLDRLETIQGNLAPWEQQMVAQVAPLVRQVAINSSANAQAASYENLEAVARMLAQAIKVDAHEARVDARARYLGPNLGMTELFR
jgi:hypothetical protein